MRMLRHQRVLLEVDLRDHLIHAGYDPSRDVVGDLFPWHLLPRVDLHCSSDSVRQQPESFNVSEHVFCSLRIAKESFLAKEMFGHRDTETQRFLRVSVSPGKSKGKGKGPLIVSSFYK